MSASTTAPVSKFAAADVLWSYAGLRSQWPLIGGFLLLLAVASATVWLMIDSERFNVSVAHTLQVRTQAYRLLTLVQDAETGQRGFLLTGNEDYLRPYEIGIVDAPRALAELRALTVRSDVQQGTVDRLRRSMQAKLRELAVTVAMGKSGDMPGAYRRVKENVGNDLMESIRSLVGTIQAEEERAQSAAARAEESNSRLLVGASLGGILVVFMLAGYAILSSGRNTRDLVKAQQDLRHNNENLESLVAERVSELQVANEEIQRFAYIVSHDLRAPLVNVMGFTSELDTVRTDIADFLDEVEKTAPELVTADRRTVIETDLPEALGFIRTSTAKMDRLINAILKLSREGRRVLTPQEIDLEALVKAQGESLSQQLASADAEVVVEGQLPTLVTDRLAVEQIFGNLIENAVKYLASGRPGRIAVSGHDHGAYRRYDIADNGRGIETKDFERIFELFRRSGEQDQPGEGIGLAYVRNLARRLGGNVTVKSEFGNGSTFTVTLPASLSTKARRS